MLMMNKVLYESSQSFLVIAKTELKIEKINEKLENWHKMSSEVSVVEVKKQKGDFTATNGMASVF